MKIRTVTVVFLSVLALAACGGAATHNTVAAKPPSVKFTATQDYKQMPDLLTALRSKGVNCAYKKADGIIIVTEEGTCTWLGHEITVDLYPDDATAKQMGEAYAALQAIGGGHMLASANWVLTTDDEATAKSLSTRLGVAVQ